MWRRRGGRGWPRKHPAQRGVGRGVPSPSGAAAGDEWRAGPWVPAQPPRRRHRRAPVVAPGDGEFAGSHECSPQIASQPCGDRFPQENLLMFRICQSRQSRTPAGTSRCPRSPGLVSTAPRGVRVWQRNNGEVHMDRAATGVGTTRVETAPHPTTAPQTHTMVSTQPTRRASRLAQPALIGMLSAGLFPPKVHAVPQIENRSNRNRHGFVVPQRVGKTPSSSWTWSASEGAPYSEIS